MKRVILFAMTVTVLGLGIAAADTDWCASQSQQVRAFISHVSQIKISCPPALG